MVWHTRIYFRNDCSRQAPDSEIILSTICLREIGSAPVSLSRYYHNLLWKCSSVTKQPIVDGSNTQTVPREQYLPATWQNSIETAKTVTQSRKPHLRGQETHPESERNVRENLLLSITQSFQHRFYTWIAFLDAQCQFANCQRQSHPWKIL